MKNYILVTGACGFVACEVIQLLLKEENSIIIGIDNLNNYYDINLKKYRLILLNKNSNFKFIEGDIENIKFLDHLFSKYNFEKVFNLAARAGVRSSIENPHVYLSTNTLGTLNILECMRKFNSKIMVLASTSSLYAGLEMPFNEESSVNTPISPYAASKKSAEMFAYTYSFLYGINISVVRYFTVYGPAGRPDMSYFKFIQSIIKNVPIDIFGDGKQTRDFTFISDIANGTVLASESRGYRIFNLGGGSKRSSILEMIDIIENRLEKKAKINYMEMNKADMVDTLADSKKARTELGWVPLVDLEEGLNRTIDWHILNQKLITQWDL